MTQIGPTFTMAGAVLASTLQHYGINLNDAATGDVATAPVIPGLEPAKNTTVAPTTLPGSE